MPSRELSLGLALDCIGLFMAAIGVIGGLSITFFKKFRTKSSTSAPTFAPTQRISRSTSTPQPFFIKRLEAGAPEVREEFSTILDPPNYSGSPSEPKLKITIYRKADQLSGTEEIYTT